VRAYRFITKISDNGTIRIPNNPTLFDKEVEIIILPKPKQDRGKMKASDFIDKWAGFLVENDTKRQRFFKPQYKNLYSNRIRKNKKIIPSNRCGDRAQGHTSAGRRSDSF